MVRSPLRQSNTAGRSLITKQPSYSNSNSNNNSKQQHPPLLPYPSQLPPSRPKRSTVRRVRCQGLDPCCGSCSTSIRTGNLHFLDSPTTTYSHSLPTYTQRLHHRHPPIYQPAAQHKSPSGSCDSSGLRWTIGSPCRRPTNMPTLLPILRLLLHGPRTTRALRGGTPSPGRGPSSCLS